MKVICINSDWKSLEHGGETRGPVVGEECTVSGEEDFMGYSFYCFIEHGAGNYFLKKSFIPLSDISETEMKREYNVQPA